LTPTIEDKSMTKIPERMISRLPATLRFVSHDRVTVLNQINVLLKQKLPQEWRRTLFSLQSSLRK